MLNEGGEIGLEFVDKMWKEGVMIAPANVNEKPQEIKIFVDTYDKDAPTYLKILNNEKIHISNNIN